MSTALTSSLRRPDDRAGTPSETDVAPKQDSPHPPSVMVLPTPCLGLAGAVRRRRRSARQSRWADALTQRLLCRDPIEAGHQVTGLAEDRRGGFRCPADLSDSRMRSGTPGFDPSGCRGWYRNLVIPLECGAILRRRLCTPGYATVLTVAAGHQRVVASIGAMYWKLPSPTVSRSVRSTVAGLS